MLLSAYIFILLQLLAVSYGDLKTRKIPHQWSYMNVVIYTVNIFLFPHIYECSIKTFIYPITFFCVGIFLFYLKVMGGGDSKYLCSLYFVIPVHFHEKSFVYLLHSTILIAPLIFIWMTIKKWRHFLLYFKMGLTSEFRKIYGSKFSFAPVILFSWVWMGWELYEKNSDSFSK